MTCPNINDPNWKALVEAIGEEQAYKEYARYGDIPNPDLYFNLQPSISKVLPLNPNKLTIVSQNLFSRFGIPVEIITREQADKQGIFKNAVGGWEGKSNKIYLIEGEADFFTAIHEFTHPFVEWIYQNNQTLYKSLKSKLIAQGITEDKAIDFLIQNGYTNLIQNGKITEDGWKEVITHEIEKVSRQIIKQQNVDTSFSKTVQTFWNKVKELLQSLGFDFSKLKNKDIPKITFGDLAALMLNKDFKLDLSNTFATDTIIDENSSAFFYKNASTSFTSAVSAQMKSYKERTGKAPSSEQLRVLNTLLKQQHLTSNDKNYYDSLTNEEYKRTTSFLNEIPGPNKEPRFFAYKADEDLGVQGRAFGNQVDKLTELIIEGVDKQTALNEVIDFFNSTAESEEQKQYTIDESVLEDLYDELKDLLQNKYKGYIQLPQVILADSNKKIAGRTDILLISPEGKLKIIDVKTTTQSLYNWMNKSYKESGSSKQRYTAQLSVYKALAKSMGLSFEEDDLSIVLVSMKISENNKSANGAVLEKEVNVNAYDYILNMFQENPDLSFDNFENTKEGFLINKMKIVLQKRLDAINKQPDSSQKKYSKKELQELIDIINQAESFKKLTQFINVIYEQFEDSEFTTASGEKKTKYGLTSQISYIKIQLQTGKISRDEAIAKIKFIKSIADLYNPLLPEIKQILNSKEEGTVKSEMLNKITTIRDSIDSINSIFEEDSIDFLTDILSENISEKANETVKQQVAALKDRISKASNDTIKNKLQKELDKLLQAVGSEEGITKEVIRKTLKEGSRKNIGFFDRWTTPAASSSNELIGTFSKLLKDKLEDARQSLIEFEKKAGKIFESLDDTGKDNPAEFNKGLYEEVKFFDGLDEEGNPKFKSRMVFVSEIDFNSLELEKSKLAQQLAKSDEKQSKSLIRDFYNKNFELRPRKDITINGVVIEKGLDTLVKEKEELFNKNIISKREYENFVESLKGYVINGVTYYNRDLLIPKKSRFTNPKFSQIPSNKKNYYNFLISSYFKSQERLPSKMGYVLPSVHKSGFDSIVEGGLKNYFSYKWDQLKNFKEEDVLRYGDDTNTIPMPYNVDMDAKDVSLDLIHSILLYEAESLEYKAKSEVADTGEILLELVTKNVPFDSDGLGNKYLDKFAEKAGVKDELLKYKKIHGNNNVAALLNMYIDSQIYGKLNIKTNAKILGLNIDKLTNSLMSFASFTQIGMNPITSTANYLQANVQANIEAAAKSDFTDKAWQQSRLIYDSNFTDFIKDFNSPYSKTFIGQLVDAFDPLQGEYKDAAGRKISKSMFKKLWSTDTWFFMQQLGEHSIQVRTMIAKMLDTKVVLKDGTITNMYDMYKNEFQKSGEIRIPEGTNGLGKLSSNGKISRSFQASLHALNKRLHGVYNNQDKIDIERYWWGRLLVMYKKFLAPGLKRRYKSYGIDFEYGDLQEGYWITFYKKMLQDASQLTRFIVGVDNQYFTEFEKQNLRRARRELLIVAISGFAIIALKSLMEAADDEDKKYYRHLLFLSMRLNNELGIYGTFGDPQNFFIPNPSEMYKTVRNPFAIQSVVNRLFSLLNQLTDPLAVYERDSGIWEKGDSKLWAKFLKFWGINGTNFDPENSIKYMQMVNN